MTSSSDEDEEFLGRRTPGTPLDEETPNERTPRTPLAQVIPNTPDSPPRRFVPRRQTSAPAAYSRPKTGRPRDEEMWTIHFRFDPLGNPNKDKRDAICNYCEKPVASGQPNSNMLKHLIKACRVIPEEVKAKLREERQDAIAAWPKPKRSAASAPAQVDAGSTSLGNNQQAARPQVTQDEFELAVAQFFYMCAISFLVVEAPAFKALFALVAPDLKLPSRKKLAGDLLKTVQEQCKAKVVRLIRSCGFVSVVTDAWTDVNGTSIVNFMVVAPGLPSLFWSSTSTGSAKHDAQYLAREIRRVIEEITAATGAMVAAVLTDNASNVTAAWQELEKQIAIFGGGCAAHVMNLLIQDICKHATITKLIENALLLTRFVRDHHALLDHFRVLQQLIDSASGRRRALVLPVQTRWYTTHACLRSVRDNKALIKDLFTGEDNAALMARYGGTPVQKSKIVKLRAIVLDESFWQRLDLVVGLLDPLIKTLRALESDSASASHVYSEFRSLNFHPSYVDRPTDNQQLRGLKKTFREAIKVRWDYVHTDFAGIAFLLDPATSTSNFVGTDEYDSMKDACNYAERTGLLQTYKMTKAELMAKLADFAMMKANWELPENKEELEFNQKMKPRAYWHQQRKKYPILRDIADRVFSIPASSAASERAWSIMDCIHTKKRNRLSVKKVEKLTYVYINNAAVSKAEESKPVDFARAEVDPESPDIAELFDDMALDDD